MTVKQVIERFDVEPGVNGDTLGGGGAVSFTVPEGEVWYVDSLVYEQQEGYPTPSPSTIEIGIAATDAPHSNIEIADLPRGASNNNVSQGGGSASLGAYAYGGETVYAGVHQADEPCQAAVLARRVL